MSASEASSLVGRRLGRFRILSRIGQGGLATVWRAHDELLGRDVALKVLNPALGAETKPRGRFLHEAQAESRLDHPGIITVFDAGESEGLAYMALTLIDGETVSDVARQRLMPVGEAVRIAIAAGEALAHAHDRGTLHRDVSGRNIMIARDGRVFVLDFGLALVAGVTRLTTSETSFGTVAYMAPEALRAEELDARSDVYGLGVVVFEALTGGYPFPGDRNEIVSWAKLNQVPRSPRELRPDVSEALDRIVLRAIATDPDDRYQTMHQMVDELRALGVVGATGTRPRIGPDRTGSPKPKPGPVDETRVTLPSPAYLAILPFTVRSEDHGAGISARDLGARMADSIGVGLGTAAGVNVVAVPTGGSELVANETLADVAERLGANLILTGDVVQSTGRLRAKYSVLDPFRGIQVASDLVDGSSARPFELEDAIIQSVWRTLGLGVRIAPRVGARRMADPADAARYQIACRYLERYDLEASVDGAIGAFEDLATRQAEDARVEAGLARAYLAKHRLTRERGWEAKAAAACERSCELAPDGVDTRIALADLDVATGRAEVACALLMRVLEERPDDYEARITLARAGVSCARHDLARTAALHAIEVRPNDWRGHSWLGVACYEVGDFEAAHAAWRRALELVPDSARALSNMAAALFRLSRLEESAAAYRRSLDLHPTAEGFRNFGAALYFLGDSAGAIVALEQAAALTPSDPVAWGNLGNACCFTPGNEARGRDALLRAIPLAQDRLESDPNHAHLWARLAGWHAHLEQRDAAEEAIRRAMALQPDDAEVLAWTAQAFRVLGDDARALEHLRGAFALGYGVDEALRGPAFKSLRGNPEFERLLSEVQHRPPGEETPVPGGGAS